MSTPSSGLKEALLQLDRAGKDRPALRGPADFFLDLLPQLFDQECTDPLPVITPDKAKSKLSDGIPLLRGENLEIDRTGFRRRWLAIARAVERHQDSNAGKALAVAPQHQQWDERKITAAALSGSPENLHARANALGQEPDLIGTAVRLCLFPVLSGWNSALTTTEASQEFSSPLAPGGREGGDEGALPLTLPGVWDRGYCANCGSWPLLGEFRGLEQTRWLRCGWCAADWKVPRLFCPFCENRDHRSLGYITVEGDGSKYRINTCESCRCYLKMLSTLSPLFPPQLLAADVATIHLDLAAAEKTYAAAKEMD